MKKRHRPLVIGNWKMNPPTISAARRLFTTVKEKTSHYNGVDIVIAPPMVFLSEMERIWNGSKKIFLGAQSVHKDTDGAHTGETSIAMLKSLNVKYVVVGHSERRAGGMTDNDVNKSVILVLKNDVYVVVCVGEQSRDMSGNYLSFIEKQVREALKGVTKSKLTNVIIAYEPIWAIGTGKTATSEDAHEMKLFIQKILTDLYGRNYARKIKVLYGGSVKSKNSKSLLNDGMVDGFLIGGASLNAEEFIDIVKKVEKYVNT